MVMVIGPTPPGTGVIAPATSLADSKSTSPHSLPASGPSCEAIDADVDHGGARLDHVAGDRSFALADRRHQDVGAAGVEGEVLRPASGTR
jgi:hypothetical protein